MRKEKVATPRAKQVWTPCSRIILLNFVPVIYRQRLKSS
jgi:hypothetical protein